MGKIKLYLNHEVEDVLSNGNTPTLKDIATILYNMCGQGVVWQLASELSERINVDYNIILVAIDDIMIKFTDMSDEEALNKFKDIGKSRRPLFKEED
jgi:hypothetical protein